MKNTWNWKATTNQTFSDNTFFIKENTKDNTIDEYNNRKKTKKLNCQRLTWPGSTTSNEGECFMPDYKSFIWRPCLDLPGWHFIMIVHLHLPSTCMTFHYEAHSHLLERHPIIMVYSYLPQWHPITMMYSHLPQWHPIITVYSHLPVWHPIL